MFLFLFLVLVVWRKNNFFELPSINQSFSFENIDPEKLIFYEPLDDKFVEQKVLFNSQITQNNGCRLDQLTWRNL